MSDSSAPGLSDHSRGVLAALVVVLCWSGFNIVSRLGSKGVMTPFDIAALRYGVSGVIALPYFMARVPPRDWPRYGVLALFGGLGYGLLVYSGFAFAPTAHAGVFVNGGIPFWTIVIVALMSGFRLERHIVMALLLSSAGLLLIGYESLVAPDAGSRWIGDILFLLAALSWAVFGLLMRRWMVRPQLAISGVATFSLLIYMLVYLLWLPKAIAASPAAEIALQGVYQGLVAALLAGGMYSYANQKIGSCQASMMLALVPGVSAVGAFFMLGEALSLHVVLGIVVVSIGAILGAMPSGGVMSLLRRSGDA
ncbi:MAG: DMT family transporter [Zoogloea oleivorans]|uniref:DMT family transporter n=1 Tax=Zoogloea oleivorans TaxID=1552750 RepID=UPI002A35DCDD|nr:DMT family transporter [Zoogloea oleivorans]MDY0034476.1 DMT family transporter [Zoogloea oleivorans]